MPTRNKLQIVLWILIFGTAATQASAGAFTAKRVTNGTQIHILGDAGDVFSVTSPNPKPPPKTVTKTGVVNILGTLLIGPVATTGAATVKNVTENKVPTATVQLFAPGSNEVVSEYALATNSSLVSGTDVFAMSGGYTTVDTNVDYDPSSPTFGTETGFLSKVDIVASGSAGTVKFNLASNPTYSVNLAPIWGEDIPPGGLSVPLDVTFSGTLFFNAIPSSFSGTFSGTDTFFTDGSTTDQGTITFDTDFGVFTGNLTASAQPVLVAVPETSTWVEMLIGFAGLGYVGWRKIAPARAFV